MDPSLQASFIPKKPLTEARGRGGGFSSLILLVAVLIFAASLASAAAAFFYEGLLNRSLEGKKDSLAKYEESFDLPSIQALVRFDTRIAEAKKVLTNHVSPSAIFFFLGEQTLEKVQLLDFEYTLNEDGKTIVSITGVADSFSTVALQSDQFGASKSLKNILFSDIRVEEDGRVSFHMLAEVDRNLILYSKNLEKGASLPPAQETTSTPEPVATSSAPEEPSAPASQ